MDRKGVNRRQQQEQHLELEAPVAVHLHGFSGKKQEARNQHYDQAADHPRFYFRGKLRGRFGLERQAHQSQVQNQDRSAENSECEQVKNLDEWKQPRRFANGVTPKRIVAPLAETQQQRPNHFGRPSSGKPFSRQSSRSWRWQGIGDSAPRGNDQNPEHQRNDRRDFRLSRRLRIQIPLRDLTADRGVKNQNIQARQHQHDHLHFEKGGAPKRDGIAAEKQHAGDDYHREARKKPRIELREHLGHPPPLQHYAQQAHVEH